nr:phosphoprotein [Paris yunnanensis betanucleorhabdovirus 1]
MNPHQIHEAYAGLPTSVLNSEVLTSNYQDAIHRAGDGDKEQAILSYMQQLSTVFSDAGITCTDEDLEAFSDVLVTLTQLDKADLAGKLLHSLKSFGKSTQASASMPATFLKNMNVVSDLLISNVMDMKKVLTDMKLVMPRKVVKAARKDALQRNTKGIKQPESKEIEQEKTPKTHDEEAGEMETDIADEGQNMIKDPNSTINVRNRGILKEHYSSDKFNELSPEKRDTYMKYYTTSILAIDGSKLADPSIYNMICDLVDKDTLLDIMEKARAKDLTTEDIEMAIDEFCDAVNSAKGCYGMYTAVPILLNGNMMTLIKDYDWSLHKSQTIRHHGQVMVVDH